MDREPQRGVGGVGSGDRAGLTVAFVAGLGRSGSTLLDRVLGQVPGCVNMGEASQIWRALSTGIRCGCGLPGLDCPFWAEVLTRTFGSLAADAAPGGRATSAGITAGLAEALRLQRRVDRMRYLGALMLPLPPGRLRRDLQRYTTLLAALYGAVAATAGAAVVVDSGKHTSTAFLLRHVPGIDLRVIHLIRDPRGVAYSWTKVVRKSHHADAAEMPRQSPSRVARRWVIHNLLLRLLVALRVRTYFLRYEDLVAQPRDRVLAVARFLDLDPAAAAVPFLSDRVVDLRRADHTLAGNPMRFRHDPITVALDDQWQQKLPAGQRRLVTIVTAPLLLAFGYRVWERPAAAARSSR